MIKQSLQLRLRQTLSITPQLQQAIKLLQLSSLDLQTEIQQIVESNPLLEYEETTASVASEDRSVQQTGEHPDKDFDRYQSTSEEENSWLKNHSHAPATSSFIGDRPTDYPAEGESLRNHLFSQIRVLPLSTTDMFIAETILDAIQEDGYLSMSVEEIHESLPIELEITPEEVTTILTVVQHLDPAGIAARDLAECLSLQLQQLPTTAQRQLALCIIKNHFEALSGKNYAMIAKSLAIDVDEVLEAVCTIQQLNPKPGNLISNTPTEYITPDVLVRKIKGRWQIILNTDISPQLKVNNYYASMIKRADDSRDNLFLKNNLQEARWFLKSLTNRNDTLLKVATLIVEQQQDFLEHGEEHMKPMVLRDIAEAIDMHESTISRVTTQKYMHTPRGIFELKYFFSSHVNTASGGECSSTAIRAMIKKLVTSEDDRKPFSDNKLAQLLEQRGIKVARRTVAKYRESLLIPPSNERRLRA